MATEVQARRPTKNEKRRQRKKSDKEKKPDGHDENTNINHRSEDDADFVAVEYVTPTLEDEAGLDQAALEQLKSIFSKFARPEDLLSNTPKANDTAPESSNNAVAVSSNNGSDIDPVSASDNKKLSKRKKKLLSRLSVAELKQLVQRPDVVEVHDVSSSNPRLLIHLKACRNTVPVPRHWCAIRKYLQGKRGVEKIPFQLPEFIAETGIAKIRESLLEQEALKKSKQRARERVRPKMGRIDIDYQVLHDAFFKHQTKPKMSAHGDLYYEGKEFEVQMKEKKPGVLSAELVAALGMTEGAPPPWLINMQRFGPPPSYPNLRIPGLNAPLPPGASYGYHPGGWGKPPVDEYGRPLYGDVFGTALAVEVDPAADVDKSYRWGTLDTTVEQEEEDDEDEDEEEEAAEEAELERAARARRDAVSGLETPASLADQSFMTGLDGTDQLDLRKRAGTETPDVSVGPARELYQVVKETKANVTGQLFGSERLYVLPGADSSAAKGTASTASVTQNEALSRHLSAAGHAQGTETEEDTRTGRKRKADSSISTRKTKEFKF